MSGHSGISNDQISSWFDKLLIERCPSWFEVSSEEKWLYLVTQVSIIIKCPGGLINWSFKCAPGGHLEMPN